jgi:hypothetical protein
MFGILDRLARMLMRPKPDLLPPPLTDLQLPPEFERKQLLDEARLNIKHTEQRLRVLEARAKFRGGLLDNGRPYDD